MDGGGSLQFVTNNWKNLKFIIDKIKKDLPLVPAAVKETKQGHNMFLINFSDLKKKWSAPTVSVEQAQLSKTLIILAEKIEYMILSGKGDSLESMLQSINSNRIKVWNSNGKRQTRRERTKNYESCSQNLIVGHFRWNHSGHTLREDEIMQMKKYFKL